MDQLDPFRKEPAASLTWEVAGNLHDSGATAFDAIQSEASQVGSKYPEKDTYSTIDIKENADTRNKYRHFYAARDFLSGIESQFGKEWIGSTDKPVASFIQQYAVPMAAGIANQGLRMAGAVSNLPGQYVDLNSDQWSLMGVGSLRAMRSPPKGTTELGMFGGQNSKTYPTHMVENAVEMEKTGIKPQDIFNETGVVKFPDGHWRYEINDSKAGFTQELLDKVQYTERYIDPRTIAETPKGWAVAETGVNGSIVQPLKTEGKFSELFHHPDLVKAYPDIENVNIKLNLGPNVKFGGLFDSKNRTLHVSANNLDDARSIALHEMQHYVQHNKEMFALGGDPRAMAESLQAMDIGRGIKDMQTKANSISDKIEILHQDMSYLSDRIQRLEKAGKPTDILKKQYAELAIDFDNQVAILSSHNNEMLQKYPSTDPGMIAYRRLMGEVEARLVQRRMDLTTRERREAFPLEMNTPHGIDVPVDEQIKWATFPKGRKTINE